MVITSVVVTSSVVVSVGLEVVGFSVVVKLVVVFSVVGGLVTLTNKMQQKGRCLQLIVKFLHRLV